MSPRGERPRFLMVGKVRKPWGTRGQVAIDVQTDFPERLSEARTLYAGDERRPLTVEAFQLHKGGGLLKVRESGDMDEAEALRGAELWIPVEEAAPLEEGAYYLYEIIGAEVWTTGGERLGEVQDVLFTGGNDVYVVQGERGEILIPAIADVVREVDREEGRIVVEPMEGLF